MPNDGKTLLPPSSSKAQDWHDLAERASKETDPHKLTELIRQLCESIDSERAHRGLAPILEKKPSGGSSGTQQAG